MTQYVVRDPIGGEAEITVDVNPRSIVVRLKGRTLTNCEAIRFDAITNFDRLSKSIVEHRRATRPKQFPGVEPKLQNEISSRFQFGKCYVVCSAKQVSPVHAGGVGRRKYTHAVLVEVFSPESPDFLVRFRIGGELQASGAVARIAFSLKDHDRIVQEVALV